MPKRGPKPGGTIAVVGADANNLKRIGVNFPLGGITVVTGVSGSGKSSLLADTLAAEGARRTHTFLGLSQREFERKDVSGFVSALPPTVLVGQRGFRPNIRTTVGTATGLLATLRKLFLLGSEPYSETVGGPVPPPSPETYAGWLAAHYRGEAEIWAVPVRQKRTDGSAAVARLAKYGVTDLRLYSETDAPRYAERGKAVDVDRFKPLNPNVAYTVEALIAKVTVGGGPSGPALLSALEKGFAAGNGSIVVMLPQSEQADLAGAFGVRLDSSRHWVHPKAPEIFYPPSVHLLSFNAPSHEWSGACPVCAGTGFSRGLRIDALVKHPDRSLGEGAFSLWTAKNYKYLHIQHETISGLAGMNGFSPEIAWRDLPQAARDLIIEGAGDELVQDRDSRGRKYGRPRAFRGFRRLILDKAMTGSKAAEQLSALVEEGVCEACAGTRWSPQARALRLAGKGIAEILDLSFVELEGLATAASAWAKAVPTALRGLVKALHDHAVALRLVGLDYLSGARGMIEVSGGESRRIRLARVLRAGEAGFAFLFDEPARGLHEQDLPDLAKAFGSLRGRHTVILNEHRPSLWRVADHFIEMGPGAGATGGDVVYAGRHSDRPPAPSQPKRVAIPAAPAGKYLTIEGAEIHNLNGVDVSIPLGRWTSICGVSGSGKSSFVRGVLLPAVVQAGRAPQDFGSRYRGRWRSIGGLDAAAELIALDQGMPAPNRRSLVATATGVMDGIRRVFAATADARREGLSASDFGINGGKGRCDACLGIGEVDDDVASPCPRCGGARFGRAALAVRADGFNIRELLDVPIRQLVKDAPAFGIPETLPAAMVDLDIGYLTLGRRVDTLSGGELQRLRLAIRLAGATDAQTLFVLDEPAAGLHPLDVSVLIGTLDRVVRDGRNSLIVVDHDLDLIGQSDWVIEFGPGAGPKGGRVVFEGPAAALRRADTPTGRALRGKQDRGTPDWPSAAAAPSGGRASARESADRTQSLLRALFTGDVAPDEAPATGIAEPAVILDMRLWDAHDAWEVGGLDLELPKLLLDMHQAAGDGSDERLLSLWRKSTGAWLAIQPVLTELAVWGKRIPASTLARARTRAAEEGLRLVDPKGREAADEADAARLRATGARFEPGEDAPDERPALLRDALALGAGYAELRSATGELLAAAGSRLVDLERGLVGPMKPVPADFSRHEPRGRCPACAGARTVAAIDNSLVIAKDAAAPDEAGFLTREADEVLRGVRRNTLIPFLRRLEKEGLWRGGIAFRRLGPDERALILHGYWTRPGPGSFLKNPSADPAEVSSWLRWDGLYAELLREAGRSRHPAWLRAIGAGTARLPCPVCDATGLRPHAALLAVADEPYPRWASALSPERKYRAVEALKPATPRQRETYGRLRKCLKPLAGGGSKEDVLELCVREFTTIRPVRPKGD
jgi:excinuclease ABC A subunit